MSVQSRGGPGRGQGRKQIYKHARIIRPQIAAELYDVLPAPAARYAAEAIEKQAVQDGLVTGEQIEAMKWRRE